MSPAAKTNSDALLDQIHGLSVADVQNQLYMRKLQRDVEFLRSADLSAYYDLSGALYAVQGDVENSRHFHQASIRYKNTANAVSNFSCSLHRMGYLREALANANEVSEREPENAQYLQRLVQIQLLCGRFESAERTAERLLRLLPNMAGGEVDTLVKGASRALRGRGIGEEDLAPIVAAVEESAHAAGCFILDPRVAEVGDDESAWMVLNVTAPGLSGADIHRLNDRLVDALVESDSCGAALATLVPRFSPRPNGNLTQ